MDATVLMIGCDLRSCSLVHVAEALAKVPYLGQVAYASYNRSLVLVDDSGKGYSVPPRDVPGDSEGFLALQHALKTAGLIHYAHFGEAEVLRFSSQDCLETAKALLHDDPGALLCSDPSCEVCPSARAMLNQPAHSSWDGTE